MFPDNSTITKYEQQMLNPENSELLHKSTKKDCDNINWLDFKGFNRDEREDLNVFDWVRHEVFKKTSWNKKKKKYVNKGIWLYAIPILGQLALLIHLLAYIGTYMFVIPLSHIWRIRAYDIQNSWCNNVKIVRNKKGMYGICFWENWIKNRMLLGFHYDLIIQTIIQKNDDKYEMEACILKRKDKYGLYNKYMRKIVMKCQYENITPVYDEGFNDIIFIAIKGEQTTYHNSKGDRVKI